MFLCIYKCKDKMFAHFQKKLSERPVFGTEDFKQIKVSSKDRVEYFKLNSWADFWGIRENLKKYKFKMLVSKAKYTDRTEIGLIVMLLNNPLRRVLLDIKQENNDISDDEFHPSLYEIRTFEDWLDCEREYDFASDIKDEIFKVIN